MNRVNWPKECLEIEQLDCKTNPEHFDRLVNHVIKEMLAKVTTEDELRATASMELIRHFIGEAVQKYDPKRNGNLAWFTYTYLRFLFVKWKSQKHKDQHQS